MVTEGLQKVSGHSNRKAFNRLCTRNSCTRDIAHNKESASLSGGVHRWFEGRSTRGKETCVEKW
jgi:hypothetical protein